MMDEQYYNDYYFARMPHPGFAVIENEALGDTTMIDENGEIGKVKTIYVGSFSKFCFSIWGLRDDIVQTVIQHSIDKVNRRIDRLVDVIKLKEGNE